MKPNRPRTAADWALHLGAELLGDGQHQVHEIAPLASAGVGAIGFLSDAQHWARAQASAVGVLIVHPSLRDAALQRLAQAQTGAVLLHANPYAAFARLTQAWQAAQQVMPEPGVHPLACVHPQAQLHPSATVEALATVEAGAVIGERAWLGPQAHVGALAVVGAGTRLMARAVVQHGCRIGARGLLHSGSVIGADGFGFAPDFASGEDGHRPGRWEKIEQLGAVVVGDDVELGANSCIDRGALEDTVIGDGVKIDNLVQIGHNVRIGAHTVIAGCVGIAGSAVIGQRCRIGGAASIIGHLELADDVVITVATVVTRSIRQAGVYSGAFPFDDNAAWEKNAATLRQLYRLRERVRALETKA